jgi:hypothetical protein
MTVSVDDAQFLRSAHQSCTCRGAFKDRPNYRVSGVFRFRCNPPAAGTLPLYPSGLSGWAGAKRPQAAADPAVM